MWISLADSIHEIIFIIVKTFDIKSSLPRTPTSSLQSVCFLLNYLLLHFIFVFILHLFSIVVSILCFILPPLPLRISVIRRLVSPSWIAVAVQSPHTSKSSSLLSGFTYFG